jgi:CheY-like chemotaxis protein
MFGKMSWHAAWSELSNRDETMISERLRILIVEDNADSRELLSMLLRIEGHEVAVANDGEQGLEAILREQPDVALVDIGLPTMTGYELVEKVRERAPSLRTRLVAVTGHGEPQDVQKAIEAGFDAHLTKPIDVHSVYRLLSSGR